MFAFIKKVFITLLIFNGSLASIANSSNVTTIHVDKQQMSVNNQLCTTRLPYLFKS